MAKNIKYFQGLWRLKIIDTEDPECLEKDEPYKPWLGGLSIWESEHKNPGALFFMFETYVGQLKYYFEELEQFEKNMIIKTHQATYYFTLAVEPTKK